MRWPFRARRTATFTYSGDLTEEQVRRVHAKMSEAFKRMDGAFAAMNEAFDEAFRDKDQPHDR